MRGQERRAEKGQFAHGAELTCRDPGERAAASIIRTRPSGKVAICGRNADAGRGIIINYLGWRLGEVKTVAVGLVLQARRQLVDVGRGDVERHAVIEQGY